MIQKTILVGNGHAQPQNITRYRNVKVRVAGLEAGNVLVGTDIGILGSIDKDGEMPIPDSMTLLSVSASTESCVVVKLVAETV